MNLPAGRLRHRVSLYAFTQGRTPSGGVTEEWTASASDIAAEFTPLSAREFIAAQAGQSQIVARVRIRFRPGVVPTMRLSFRGAMYDIKGVLPDNESGLEYLTLTCSQLTGAEGVVP